jgi:hypothetical protein
MEKGNFLSLIVVVPKNNNKLWIYMDFQWFNAATKNDPKTLPFTREVLNKVARHEIYLFLGRFSSYHQIMIAER